MSERAVAICAVAGTLPFRTGSRPIAVELEPGTSRAESAAIDIVVSITVAASRGQSGRAPQATSAEGNVFGCRRPEIRKGVAIVMSIVWGISEMRLKLSLQPKQLRMLALAFVIATAASEVRAADNAEDFYKNKTVTFAVAAPPGGSYDTSTRLAARYLGEYLPGHPTVIVQNMPGAGGYRLANYLAFTAPRDGSVIGMHTRGVLQAPILGDPAAHYDPLAFSWLGTLSSSKNDAYFLVVSKSSGIHNIDDMRRAGAPISLGSVGGITSDVTFGMLSPYLFGFNTHLVKGYEGSAEVMLAVRRGELAGTYMGLSSLSGVYKEALASGELVPILQLGRATRHPRFSTIPTAEEVVTDPEKKALLSFVESVFYVALPVSGPPGLPADRFQTLQSAFVKLADDPRYLEDAKKIGIDPSFVDGDAVRRTILDMKKTPSDALEAYKKMLQE
jgi:tripartite-type tricarboxylate transporter receptor subunit TctC